MDRAYSLLTVKGVSEAPNEWVITGVASTPSTDRMGDQVDPMGAKFKTPMPLLWQHQSGQPVGRVEFATPTKTGIPFVAHLPKVAEAGVLKDRIDEAVQSIKYRLVSAVSIGFRALEGGVERIKETGGTLFKSWEWLELSLVTIPANSEATITSIKSIDSALLAASGRKRSDVDPPPGASGTKQPASGGVFHSRSLKGNDMQTIQELQEARNTSAARCTELRDAAKAADRQFSDAEADEFDGLTDHIKGLDNEIRLMRFDQTNAASARVVRGFSQAEATRSRIMAPNTSKSNLPKGTAFIRYVIAMANGRGSVSDALAYAKRWDDSTPEVSLYIKAVAGSHTGGSDTWGSEISQPLMQEFVELLMPETILGKINGFRRVPFNVQVRVQTAGGLVNWVGEGQVKPVGEQAFDTFTLDIDKVAGIIVLTEEQVRLSTPNAEALVRSDMIKQVSRFLDVQFLDPTVSASDDNPASVLNTSTAIPASGTDAAAFRTDMRALRSAFRAANLSTAGSAIIMTGTMADALADMQNALGQPEFPTISSAGGTYRGSQLVISESVPTDSTGSLIAMVKASEILLADDGVTLIDASREATLDMGTSDGATFNLWQRNCVGIRAERWITWQKARDEAAQYISGAAYDPDGGS